MYDYTTIDLISQKYGFIVFDYAASGWISKKYGFLGYDFTLLGWIHRNMAFFLCMIMEGLAEFHRMHGSEGCGSD